MAMRKRSMGLIKKTKREVNFTKNESGDIFLCRPPGWLAGWMRHLWFTHLTGIKPNIASPKYWQELSEKNGELKLIEYEDGSYEIRDESR